MHSNKIAVFIHLYYPHSYEELKQLIPFSDEPDVLIMVNVVNDYQNKNKATLIEFQKNTRHPLFIIETPNIGKDIGGKLALMDLYLRTNQKSDYILLLHDKQSPQVLYGEKWKNSLMKIAEKNSINTIKKLFETNPDAGIICASECISNEYDAAGKEFKTTNNLILKEYIKRVDFKLSDYSFVAGNMFWVRSCIYEAFFKKYTPLALRSELEKGNVIDNEFGTKTHALERIFSWIAPSQGYKILEYKQC